MQEKNLERSEESMERKLRQLREMAADEAEASWIAVGNYLDSLNKGEKVDKEELLASISSSSEEVKDKARSLCDFVDLLVSAREANNRMRKA